MQDGEQTARLVRGATRGRYVILGQVGEGTTGVVYAAYDPRLDRRVALKFLRHEWTGLAMAEARARLLREAQAMAQLSHPNLVAVYDAGELDGEVHLAMEYVEGATLRAWLDERPRSWREVLHAFLEAGRGVAAAHGAGIVHRDLKPENVMIDRHGRARVTDFGLARPSGPGGVAGAAGTAPAPALTRTVALLGTPAYMAPEQLRGEAVDHRADQFGFCVALHEALHGERPFAGDTLEELAAAASAGKVRPAPRGSGVPPWIRRVLLRGLAPDPAARFPSLDALLSALGRDPARARARWAGVALLGLLAVAGGLGVAILKDRAGRVCQAGPERLGVWDDALRRQGRRAFLSSGLPYAPDAWESARRALDGYAAGWIATYQDACWSHQRREQPAALLDLRMQCLERRRQELGELASLLSSADGGVVEHAVPATGALTPLAACSDAAALAGHARAPEDPARMRKVGTIEAELARVKALTATGRFREALASGEAALAAAREVGHPATLAEALLAVADPASELETSGRPEALLREAVGAALTSHHDEVLARALTALVTMVGDDPPRQAEALRLAEHARGAIAALGPGHEALEGDRLCSVSDVLWGGAGLEDAARAAEQCLAAYQRAIPPNPVLVARAHVALAATRMSMGSLEDAAGEFRAAAQALEAALGPRHPEVAAALADEGAALRDLGDARSALPLLRRALEIREAALGPGSHAAAKTLVHLGRALGDLGRHAEAWAALQRALRISQERAAWWPCGVTWVLAAMTELQVHRGDIPGALTAARRMAASYTAAVGSDRWILAFALRQEGEAFLTAGRPRQAIARLERCIAVQGMTFTGAWERAESRFWLARALVAAGRGGGRALALAREARDLYRMQGRGYAARAREVEAWLAGRR